MEIASFVCNALEENTYILYDETQECVIVDAGCVSENEKEEIESFVSQHHLNVKAQLYTHLHLDHCLGANFITSRYGVKARAHRLEHSMPERMQHLLNWMGMDKKDFSITLGEPIEEGEMIVFGNTTLQVLHTPGHSPGGLVFYEEKGGNLLSGDVLFQGSVGRSDLFGGNPIQLIHSIKTKLLTLPDNTKVYPGHGGFTTLGEEKKGNPFIQ